MRNKSVVNEAREIRVASELIKLDARLQVLESETQLSRERLLRLYKELKGKYDGQDEITVARIQKE